VTMRAALAMPRPHIGTTPCKFSFQANDLNVTLHRVGYEGKLVIAFKRGASRRETEPIPIKEGMQKSDGGLVRMASTSQDLALLVTMFRRKKGGFESKEAAFTLTEEGRDGKDRKLGTARFDLSDYAEATSVPKPLDLKFGDSDGEVTATLRCMVAARWLRRMSANAADSDDAASVASGMSAASAASASGRPGPSLGSLPRVPAGTPAAPIGSGASASASGGGGRGSGGRGSGGGGGGGGGEGREAAESDPWANDPAFGGWAPPKNSEALREELRLAEQELAAGRQEAAQLRAQVDALTKKQRELRRAAAPDWSGNGGRDDVILQLEMALELKDAEKMKQEEALSDAFSGVVRDLQERVNSLTAERDKAMIQIERLGGKRVASL